MGTPKKIRSDLSRLDRREQNYYLLHSEQTTQPKDQNETNNKAKILHTLDLNGITSSRRIHSPNIYTYVYVMILYLSHLQQTNLCKMRRSSSSLH